MFLQSANEIDIFLENLLFFKNIELFFTIAYRDLLVNIRCNISKMCVKIQYKGEHYETQSPRLPTHNN